MNEIELLTQINNKIDKLIAVTAIQGKDEDKQIKILKALDLSYNEISKLTGIPEGTLKWRDHSKRRKK